MSTERPDYYAVLGVEQDASAEALRAAYRALAGRYHPDRNAGDADATARFKALVEAWSVLGDPDRRDAYDRARADPPLQIEPGGGLAEVVGGIVDGLFGVKDRRCVQGRNRLYRLTVSFAEAMRGSTQTLKLPRESVCGTCAGRGFGAGVVPEICGRCRGRGEVQGRPFLRSALMACPDCAGRGWLTDDPCAACQGSGGISESRKVAIDLVAGIHDGQELRVRGAGEAGRFGGDDGDLTVRVNVEPHRSLRRDGRDIRLVRPVSVFDALLGGSLDVPTIHGRRSIRLPPCTAHGTVLRMQGYGVALESAGDQLVTIQLEMPSQLDEATASAVRALGGQLDPARFEATRRFEEQNLDES